MQRKWTLTPFLCCVFVLPVFARAVSRVAAGICLFLFCLQAPLLAAEDPSDLQGAECRKSLTDQNFVRVRSFLTASEKFSEKRRQSGGSGTIVFVKENASTIVQNKQCFIEIPVYSDGSATLHLFAIFAVSLSGVVLMMNTDGDYVE
jgi:hypothetical protein